MLNIGTWEKDVQTEIYTYICCLFNLERFDLIIYIIFRYTIDDALTNPSNNGKFIAC